MNLVDPKMLEPIVEKDLYIKNNISHLSIFLHIHVLSYAWMPLKCPSHLGPGPLCLD